MNDKFHKDDHKDQGGRLSQEQPPKSDDEWPEADHSENSVLPKPGSRLDVSDVDTEGLHDVPALETNKVGPQDSGSMNMANNDRHDGNELRLKRPLNIWGTKNIIILMSNLKLECDKLLA